MIRPAASLLALLLLAGCSAGNDGESAGDPVALVSLARAEPGAIPAEVRLFGTAESGASGRQGLTAATDAVVTQIVAPVGSRVSRGDVIAVLAPAPAARLDLAKAATDARAADATLARAQRLRADGLVGDAEVEAARAAATSARATQASLSSRAGALTLRAPTAGFVEALTAKPGDMVAAGTAIAMIGSSGDVRARFGADPATARALRTGTLVEIVPAAGRAAFSVPVASVDPAVDPQTRLASVFVRLPPGASIASGEPLEGKVRIGSGVGALTIPYAALLDDGGQPFVFVVSGGAAHRHDVETGPASGDRIAIIKGLAAGDQVVTEGGTALEDGMKVRTR